MILLLNSAGAIQSRTHGIEFSVRSLPYGSSVLVAYLRSHGYEVIHKDLRNLVSPLLPVQLSSNDFDQWLNYDRTTRQMDRYLDYCFKELPDLSIVDVIGFSIFSFINFPYGIALAKKIAVLFPMLPICFGGPYITSKDIVLPPYIPFFIKGCGTVPFEMLIKNLISDDPLNCDIPGLCYKRDNKLICNEGYEEIAEEEILADFSDLDLNRYHLLGAVRIPYRTSIGCSNKCRFCTSRLSKRPKYKSKNKVIGDITALLKLKTKVHDTYSLRIFFCDNSLNNNHKLISEIFDEIIDTKLHFQWEAHSKFHNMTIPLLEKFRRSGCQTIYWGLDGGSDHMLKIFDKRICLDDTIRMFDKAATLRITNIIYVIYNGPQETMKDFSSLLNFCRKHGRNRYIFFLPVLFLLEEGSIFSENPEKFGIICHRNKNLEADLTRRVSYSWHPAESDKLRHSLVTTYKSIRIASLQGELYLHKYLELYGFNPKTALHLSASNVYISTVSLYNSFIERLVSNNLGSKTSRLKAIARLLRNKR